MGCSHCDECASRHRPIALYFRWAWFAEARTPSEHNPCARSEGNLPVVFLRGIERNSTFATLRSSVTGRPADIRYVGLGNVTGFQSVAANCEPTSLRVAMTFGRASMKDLSFTNGDNLVWRESGTIGGSFPSAPRIPSVPGQLLLRMLLPGFVLQVFYQHAL